MTLFTYNYSSNYDHFLGELLRYMHLTTNEKEEISKKY